MALWPAITLTALELAFAPFLCAQEIHGPLVGTIPDTTGGRSFPAGKTSWYRNLATVICRRKDGC